MKNLYLLLFILLNFQQINCQANVIEEILLEQDIKGTQHPTYDFQVTLPQRDQDVLARSQFYLIVEIVFDKVPDVEKESYFLEISENPIQSYDSQKNYEELVTDYKHVWRQNKYRSIYQYFARTEQPTPYFIGLHNILGQKEEGTLDFNIRAYIKQDHVCPNNCLNGGCFFIGCTCDKGHFDQNCSLYAEIIKNQQLLKIKKNEWKFFYWPINIQNNNYDVKLILDNVKKQGFQYSIWMGQFDLIEQFWSHKKISNNKIVQDFNIENKSGVNIYVGIQGLLDMKESQLELQIQLKQGNEKQDTKGVNIILVIVIILCSIIFFIVIIVIIFKQWKKQDRENTVQPSQQDQQQQQQDQNIQFPQNNQFLNLALENQQNNNETEQNTQQQQQQQQNSENNTQLKKSYSISESNYKSQTLGMYYVSKQLQDNDFVEPSATQCSICCISILKKEEIIPLECGHIFHQKCLKDWIKKNKTCPLCRAKLKQNPNQVFDFNNQNAI